MRSPLASRHIQARNFTDVSSRKVDLIVIHTAEVAEMGTSAEAVANFFANQAKGNNGSSAHYCTDNNSIVSCVDEQDVAWAAPGANHNGIQIEISGRAAQNLAQWNDPFSEATMALTSRLAADIAKRHSIPIRHLTNDQLRAGMRGIIGHRQASQVFKRSTHTDPGTAFPWAEFIRETKAELEAVSAVFRFILADGEGKRLAMSAPFTRKADLNKRWMMFAQAVNDKILRELFDDRDATITLRTE